MPKGKKKKGGSAKPKSAKGDKKGGKKGGRIQPTNPCSNCNDKEATENASCEHVFCKDCFDNLTMEGIFRCSICEDASEVQGPISQPNGAPVSYMQKPVLPPTPKLKFVADFVTLGKGVKKVSSFTHLGLDTTERVVIDRNETFICMNPVDHRIYMYRHEKLYKSVKYLYNHGFTGGLSITYDEQILIALQGAKFTSICCYNSEGKFRKSSFFQKGAYAHSITVGTNNNVFALDAENQLLHFFNRERRMSQSWTLRSLAAQGVDLWESTLHATKDNKLFLFDAVNCQLHEIINDDEVLLRVSFSEEATTLPEQSAESDGSTDSIPTEVYDSMWTKKKLTYNSSDEEKDATDTDGNISSGNESKPKAAAKPKPAATFLHEIKEDSEPAASSQNSIDLEVFESKAAKEKAGKKGKKGKGGKKKKGGGNANKNNNANGDIQEEQEENVAVALLPPSETDSDKGETDESGTQTQEVESKPQPSIVPQNRLPPLPQKVVPKRKPFNPKNHPSLLVLDKYDCMLVAHRGQIALFSPEGEYIKSIADLKELDDDHYKITIKAIIPFGDNQLAVLWHKHGGYNMYRFFEIYTYKAPKKYKRIKSSFGRRKFTYDYDLEYENWLENKPQSSCCVIQ